MSYLNYLNQARESSDRISSGDYTPLSTPKDDAEESTGGLMSRMVKEDTAKPSTEDMILRYMGSMRPPVEEGIDTRVLENRFRGTGIDAAREALATIESRGSGGYSARGPVVKSGMYRGQRALGRYQVMPGNVPSWTKKALGRSMTPDEFLASSEAQDAVVNYQLQSSFDKYGTWEDAASVWFSGKPVRRAGSVSDGNLTTPEYLQKFTRYYQQYSQPRRGR
ncbi:MAG: hypothetical protein COA78_20335 [Blastopirellula sp.]|nr:MAG: hypothetical protein COA78_20335 [Blastopirellula sp.]